MRVARSALSLSLSLSLSLHASYIWVRCVASTSSSDYALLSLFTLSEAAKVRMHVKIATIPYVLDVLSRQITERASPEPT